MQNDFTEMLLMMFSTKIAQMVLLCGSKGLSEPLLTTAQNIISTCVKIQVSNLGPYGPLVYIIGRACAT